MKKQIAAVAKTNEEVLASYRRVRDEIKKFVEALLNRQDIQSKHEG